MSVKYHTASLVRFVQRPADTADIDLSLSYDRKTCDLL